MRQALLHRLLYFGLLISALRLFWIFVSGNNAGMGVALTVFALVFIGVMVLFRGTWNGGGKSGGNVLLEDSIFDRLRRQYETLARQKKEAHQYVDASRIYLNLLKDPYRAAQTLEEGALYAEAGVLYEKRLQQLPQAAACYEKAHLYDRAISLYGQLNEREKLGDIYTLLGDKKKAAHWYERTVEDYLKNAQYVKAALVCRKKMNDPARAQALLLLGWQRNQDAFNCLNNYFAAIAEPEMLREVLKKIAAETTRDFQQDVLLRALHYEFDKGDAATQTLTRQLAHRLIAARVASQPDAIQAMRHFHKDDKMMPRDVQKYKARKAGLR